MKANIAYGGRNSGKTKIEINEIKHSTAEGIFVVEGEEPTLIFENVINSNKDGILALNSQGSIKNNTILSNLRTGIHIAGNSTVEVLSNTIKDNISIGIHVKDPSLPVI